jgi:hypothetical protein
MNILIKKSLPAFLLLACFALYGQTERGTVMLGGSAGLTDTNQSFSLIGGDQNSKHISASFAPNLGYFVADRFAVGMTFAFSLSNTTHEDFDLESRYTSFGLGPAFRYYVLLDDRWAVFPTLAYTFETFTFKSTQVDPISGELFPQTTKSKGSIFKGGAGITYFINKSVGIEGLLFYQGSRANEGASTSSSVQFNIGFQIYFNQE